MRRRLPDRYLEIGRTTASVVPRTAGIGQYVWVGPRAHRPSNEPQRSVAAKLAVPPVRGPSRSIMFRTHTGAEFVHTALERNTTGPIDTTAATGGLIASPPSAFWRGGYPPRMR